MTLEQAKKHFEALTVAAHRDVLPALLALRLKTFHHRVWHRFRAARDPRTELKRKEHAKSIFVRGDQAAALVNKASELVEGQSSTVPLFTGRSSRTRRQNGPLGARCHAPTSLGTLSTPNGRDKCRRDPSG